MYISFYIEVDNEGKALYKEEFLNLCKNNKEGKLIVSKEYKNVVLDMKTENILVIPDEVLDDLDKNLKDKRDRRIALGIYKMDSLYNWIINELKNCESIDGLMAQYEYPVLVEVAEKMNVKLYVALEEIAKDNVKKMEQFVEEMKKELDVSKANEESLKNVVSSKDEYIQQIQVKNSNLERENYKNNQIVEKHNNELRNYEQRIEKTEKSKYLYLDMYKNLLEEFDMLKVELLELKSRKK